VLCPLSESLFLRRQRATKEQGEVDIESWINTVVRAIKAIKAEDESLKLQIEFYERSSHPLDTAY
jgi:creatinine amidohydrolase